MKKVYELEGLCCPNCAAKIEDAVAALDGVTSCRLTFLTKKMTLNIADEKFSQVPWNRPCTALKWMWKSSNVPER